jgi:GDP-L-fucose synthase
MIDMNNDALPTFSQTDAAFCLSGKVCLVTGGGGVLGSAVLRELSKCSLAKLLAPNRSELDLSDLQSTERYFAHNQPEVVIHLAATVFGLAGNMENQRRAVFENSAINHNVFLAVSRYQPQKIFFAGTVASYPFPYSSMPLKETSFFDGLPHDGEFGYAMAKRHAYSYLKVLAEEGMCNYVYGVFTNLYGEHDKFDLRGGHVIPSLIRKAYEAARCGAPLVVWGDGTAQRDFLHAEDAARAVIFSLERAPVNQVVNISSGRGITIREITEIVSRAAGIRDVIFDTTQPTGIPLRVVDNSKMLSLGFRPRLSMETGLNRTFRWYSENQAGART